MKMYRGDLKPDLRIAITENGEPVDLDDATSIRILGSSGGDLFFDRQPASVVDGVVTMEWELSDTDEVRRIMVEVEVTWPVGKPQTFRPSGSITVVADFG